MTMISHQAPCKTPSIVKLVSWERWHHLRDILQRIHDGDQEVPVFDDRAKNRLPEEHILHLAVQHQAPLQIVGLLHERYPHSVSTPENKGRYPVHIACAKGLSPKVVDFLIKKHPQAAGVQDSFGKTPLHYTCESYAYNFRTIPSNAYRSPDKSMCATVALLLERAPESANVDDHNDMNAIEYAIESDADIRIIKEMQNASRENWRKLQKIHQEKSHEELRRSISWLSTSMNSLISAENTEEIAEQPTKIEKDKTSRSAHPMGAPELKVQTARTA